MLRWTGLASALMLLSACASYVPAEPRYPTRPVPPAGSYQGAVGLPAETAPPPVDETYGAPVDGIDSAPLPPAGGTAMPAPLPAPASLPAPAMPSMTPGAAYVIQQGDTLSGVARRFQTPVQTLIDLNGLGPRGDIRAGGRLILPDSAIDIGHDPYATGPSPVGVLVADAGTTPPPPLPPSGNPPAPVTAPPPPPTMTPPPAERPVPPVRPQSNAQRTQDQGIFEWPVRGEVVRRFGPAGMGLRNDGIHIAAPEGEAVRAAAAGRVAYVGSDLPGLGRTVVIVHRDGWRSAYSHLGSISVRAEQDVRQGEVIGTVGTSAGDGRPSIQFETRRMSGDQPVPVDPLSLLPR
ncbi:MAG: peptidoglycan DD-metalloendopeptidase family protein [Brevundimonas sp.]|uniref:peptidoglycan DD-metalloendopeptidase family protein n=1 Tax=Brevundimonas sp. TaxID=1871086 RepID=UPI00391C8F77